MADRDAGRQTIIFISRAGEDADFAAEIGRILRGAGYRVILQQGDFDNQNFMHKIHEALDLSRHVIALLSPDYMESDYCELEWTATLAHDPLNRRGRLIVMRIADCTPKGILAALAYWDLVPIRGDAATTREVALMAVRADMQKLDAEAACPFFHRASWPFLLSQKIVHREEIHDVPIFTGRKAELEALRDTLHKKGGTAALTNSKSAALHGLGGVGKTTLARKYAWDEQENYCGVWWIGAQKHEGLVGDLVKLGKELFPGIQHMRDPRQAARAVLGFIEEGQFGKPWLLIYDNVENPRDLDGWTPRTGAHVIVTSRWPYWQDEAAEQLPVDLFTPGVATDFLIACAPGFGRDPDVVKAAAGRLAADLGYLPLALAHARSYCWRSERSFDDYRERLPKLIKAAPKDATHPAVFATFDLAITEASRNEPEAEKPGCPEAEKLMNIVAFMAPERIPQSIITSDVMSAEKREKAVEALADVSLVVAGELDDGSLSISMHRLVQAVARGRLSDEQRGEALNSLVKALEAELPINPLPLISHVVELIHVLNMEENQQLEASESSGRLVQLIIMALRSPGERKDSSEKRKEGGRVVPEHIVTLIGDFYEADPLKGAIDLLLKDHRPAWPRLQEKLLETNNYVLRYAMAESLADACTEEPTSMELDEVAALIVEKRLYEFELGGYALGFIYARKPELIDPANPANKANLSNLEMLAGRPEYPGRSILGDLFLNLVFRDDIAHTTNLRGLLKSERFWNPIWDFIKYDVWAIEAAEAFIARKSPARGAAPEVRDMFRNFLNIEKGIAKAKRSPNLKESARGLLNDYWKLGQHIGRIADAKEDLASLDTGALYDVMRLLFAHPIWSVSEAAATVLSTLIGLKPARGKKLSKLIRDKNWCVQFGTLEVAFARRHVDKKGFFDSVRKFHNHKNCKIRGAVAGNIEFYILNSAKAKQKLLLESFKKEFQYWLSESDEDCWVLDHVYRMIHALHKDGQDIEPLFPMNPSRLLTGMTDWYARERGEFLRHIEDRKKELQKSNYFTRTTKGKLQWPRFSR